MCCPVNSEILTHYCIVGSQSVSATVRCNLRKMPALLQKLLLSLFALLVLSGCSSISYYLHAINGHAELLNRQQPVNEVINDPQTSEAVRAALLEFQQARTFAVDVLHLPDNDSYRYYADIERNYAAWNVIAAPALSVEPRQWCYLIAGCFNYRGFFNEQKAMDYAKQLQQAGFDTYVAGARAYSTLGWFDDPLLNTMLVQNEARRIGILFHELAHQKIYVDDDSAFNEGFAVFIEQEGVRRWLQSKNQPYKAAQYAQTLHRRRQFHTLLLDYRHKLDRLYHSQQSDEDKLQLKRILFSRLKQAYRQLRQQWHGYSGYDSWMSRPLNNAHLALVATYREQVSYFEQLLAGHDGDLTAFYQAVEQLADLPAEQRRQRLADIGT